MKFFVNHYTPLIKRKSHVIHEFNRHGILEYEFIEEYNKETIHTHPLFDKFSSSRLNDAEKSIFIKNIEIFNKQINDIVIVLEDDLILTDHFLDKLNNYLNNLPPDWDVLFTCECSNIHAECINPHQIFYKSTSSRGAGMYILNKHMSSILSTICNSEIMFNKPIDHWFTWMLKIHNFKYYYSEPTLCCQGSEKNPTFFTNSIITNNKRYNYINGPKLYFITFDHNIAIQASKMNLFEHIFNFTESSGTSKSSIFKKINNILNENDILFYYDVNDEMEMEISNIKNIKKLQTIKNGILTFSSKKSF